MRRLILALGALALATPASAHGGHHHEIGWTFDPAITVPLALLALVYIAGFVRLRARSRNNRVSLDRRAGYFAAGWLVLAGALVSPLHEAGEVSFTLHMIEHELIMLPAALLLVAAQPGATLLWGLPASGRGLMAPVVRLGLWRSLAAPVTATAIQAAVLVLWHMPALFDMALDDAWWHTAQHLSFVFGALLFWHAMLARPNGASAQLVAAMCLFATSMIGGGLGALMALAHSPWYAGYAKLGQASFGLSAVEDQQLAGLIMWIPGGLFHLAAALILLGQALRSTPKVLDNGVRGRGDAA